MPVRKKIVVQLKVNHHENFIHVIDSLFANTVKPDLVFLDMSSIEYPHRTMDLPWELVEYAGKNPKVKFIWDGNNPLPKDEDYIISVDSKCPLDSDYIKTYVETYQNKLAIGWGKFSSQEVTVGLCTQPHRKEPMLNVVKSLLPQCDRLCLCLNNYDRIPPELPKTDKLICVMAGEGRQYADLGAQNKMLFLGDYDGYFASVDDDLDYPSNYIEQMKKRVDYYNRERICSLHGMIWELDHSCVIDKRKRAGFWQYFQHNEDDHLCHCVGMGVAMYYPKKIKLDKFFYLNYPKNIGDDQITAVWSMVTGTKLMQVNNIGIDVKPTTYAYKGMYSDKMGRIIRENFVKSYKHWKGIDIWRNEYLDDGYENSIRN